MKNIDNSNNSYDLIPVADSERLKECGIHFSQKTLRKWSCVGVNAQLFIRLNGRLFILRSEWIKLIDNARLETEARVSKLKEKGLLD